MCEMYLRKGGHQKLHLQAPENETPQEVTALLGKALDDPYDQVRVSEPI